MSGVGECELVDPLPREGVMQRVIARLFKNVACLGRAIAGYHAAATAQRHPQPFPRAGAEHNTIHRI